MGSIFRILTLGLAIFWTVCRARPEAVTVVLAAGQPGGSISDRFAGFSFERKQLLPDPAGRRYFRPDNEALVELFRTLGIRSLRIGGNTSDRDATEPPGPEDFASLFAFARAAGVKVLYCLRLRGGNPAAEAQTVKYLTGRYGAEIDCFSIGQEPSAYPVDKVDLRPPAERMGGKAEKYPYAEYRTEWKRFEEAIAAAVPGVRLCGPSVHNNPDWTRRFLADFGSADHVALITEHLYPGGAGGKVPTPEVGRDRMLSDGFTNVDRKLCEGFVPEAAAKGIPYRLEEANNYFNGGAAGVSDTFAAALWGLDFMHWWAAHGAAGINFHTGDRVAAGARLQVARYASFLTTADGLLIRPLSYGVKAFDLGARGRLLSASLAANAGRLNLSAYAVATADGGVAVTLINKEHGPGGRAAAVRLVVGSRYQHPEAITLAAPKGDVAATDGITLGGAAIESDGRWRGRWSPLPEPDAAGVLTLELPAATAVVVRCQPK